ncbi:hypothetical protein Ntsu_33290 [Nocardia sp. IFM 10818]
MSGRRVGELTEICDRALPAWSGIVTQRRSAVSTADEPGLRRAEDPILRLTGGGICSPGGELGRQPGVRGNNGVHLPAAGTASTSTLGPRRDRVRLRPRSLSAVTVAAVFSWGPSRLPPIRLSAAEFPA